MSAVNAISVKHNLVFCGRDQLTFMGSAIADFCILRDANYITTLKKFFDNEIDNYDNIDKKDNYDNYDRRRDNNINDIDSY